MSDFLRTLLNSNSFMPHGHCYFWQPNILWLNVGSDIIIALSYYTIPLFLVYFVKKRRDLAFDWIFVMFALFILACGTTHLVEIWTTWNPQYGIQGLVKAFTAMISFATALALAPLMPKALALPSPKDLEKSSFELKRLNDELKQVNSTLEQKVLEKTKDIAGLAAIVKYSSDAIFSKDNIGQITSWNPAAHRLFGYSANEAIGKSVYTLVPEELHTEMDQILSKVNSGLRTEALDTVRLTKDNKRVDVSLTISPIKDSAGQVISSASILRDITSRKLAEQELQKSEERFRLVIEATPTGILMADRQGKIILCNKEFETLFGYNRQELIGHEMEFLVPERFRTDHPAHRTSFFMSPESRQMGAGRDLYGLHKNGTEIPVEIGLNPLIIFEDMFVLASVVDITKRKTLEKHLRRSATALQQKNQEMEQFVYTVSHDLKSPLVTSTGFLGLLKEDLLAKRYNKVTDSIARLERANNRMSQLIDDLLQLSRIGRIKLELEQIDVTNLIKGICENISSQISEKSVVINIQPNMATLRADRKRIYQAFENLIINALKYACDGPNPKIEIGCNETLEELRFYVKDYGPGILKEYHQKIFGLFQRLESDDRGTGVGLTIVSRIMKLHGGRVWLDSDMGEGACFWLGFPKFFIEQEEVEHG